MAKATKEKNDTQATPEVPEVTIESLVQNTEQGVENARAILFKQMGAAELMKSLKNEGYRLVKDEE